jgi:hypothetical protein
MAQGSFLTGLPSEPKSPSPFGLGLVIAHGWISGWTWTARSTVRRLAPFAERKAREPEADEQAVGANAAHAGALPNRLAPASVIRECPARP